jgi:peptidoglycan L-alanyl-D-glutamate endopeptidase CwlK
MTDFRPMVISMRDERRLEGVHPALVGVVREAMGRCRFRVRVLEGVRTMERQRELYAQGRTAPGKIVTWSMESRHLTGHAVDLAPIDDNGVLDWNDTRRFTELAIAMLSSAAELGVPLRWGADWDGDGNFREKGEYDSPHFELPRRAFP